MIPTRLVVAIMLCVALAVSSAGAQPGNPNNPVPTPVTLPPALKAAIMKRVTIDKTMEGTPEELLLKLAKEHKFSIDIHKGWKTVWVEEKRKASIPPQKEVRLDLILHDLLMQNGGAIYCVARKDTLAIVDPSESVAKLAGNRLGYQTILQPPDATHLALSNPVKKKLTTKIDPLAGGPQRMKDILDNLEKKHDIKFAVNYEKLNRGDNPEKFEERRVTVKDVKGVTIEAFLKETLKSIDAQAVLNPYTGKLEVLPLEKK